MARVIYCHPSQTRHAYHVYTDLDFWDARKLLGNLATVGRNFGHQPDGDVYPSQVVADSISRIEIRVIERRLAMAIASPPRHVMVKAILLDGAYEFDPKTYYPERWGPTLMLHFTRQRLPMQQSAISSPYKTVRLTLTEAGNIRIEQVRRTEKHDPVIRTHHDAMRRQIVPSCF